MLRSLNAKVVAGTLLFAVVIAVALGATVVQVRMIEDAIDHLSHETVDELTAQSQYNTSMQRSIGDMALLLLGDADEEEDSAETLDEAQAALDRLDAMYAAEEQDEHSEENMAALVDLQRERRALLVDTRELLGRVVAEHDSAVFIESVRELDRRAEVLTPISDHLSAAMLEDVTAGVALSLRQLYMTIAALLGVLAILVIAPYFVLRRIMVRPLVALAAAQQAVAEGDLDYRVEVTNNDEIGVLQQRFNEVTRTLRAQQDELTERLAAATEARRLAEAAEARAAEQLTTIQEQHEVIRGMSIPILPVLDGLLVVPLVGTLDQGRMELLQEHVLRSIQALHARLLLIDVTGVPVIDASVAEGLMRVVQAASLLGARITLVGIRPEVAEALVTIGIDLQTIRTHATLQGGLQGYLQRIAGLAARAS